MTSRRRRIIGWGIGIAAVVVGAVVFVIGRDQPAEFSWYAYQPIANDVYVPDPAGFYVSPASAIGALIVVLGLMALAFLAGGWVRGRNHAKTPA